MTHFTQRGLTVLMISVLASLTLACGKKDAGN